MGCGRSWGGPFSHHGVPYPYYHYRDWDAYGSRDLYSIREELDRLYAGGEIDHDQYRDARHRLKHGDFTWSDLRELRHHYEPPRGKEPRDRAVFPGDIAKPMDEFQAKRAEVERAEDETARLLEKLRGSVARLNDDMVRYESLAKGAVGVDESQARLYLQRRQTAAEQAAGLEARIKELGKDVERLQALKADLDAKILGLTAVGQRDRLARLESEIKGLQP